MTDDLAGKRIVADVPAGDKRQNDTRTGSTNQDVDTEVDRGLRGSSLALLVEADYFQVERCTRCLDC
jgi:hypothetical protein